MFQFLVRRQLKNRNFELVTDKDMVCNFPVHGIPGLVYLKEVGGGAPEQGNRHAGQDTHCYQFL